MATTLIRASGIGKSYVIRHQAKKWDRNRTIRDEIAQAAQNLFRRKKGPGESLPEREIFWALKDVSFEIKQGESVGFIGHNGAGKSTLLKLISRITDPTTGEFEITGRVGSLLEVSTGFHAELTGRENIYLKGAIMGMKRAETRAKFDEIVEFAEIDRFLDTPVKRYSSGMYVKLGFAVAAHLDPEILIVDEVLAVGDANFQKKCLAKMQNMVSQGGRTLLFVSHNLAIIKTLCSRAILLRAGEVVHDGTADEAVGRYLKLLDQASTEDLAARRDRRGSGQVRLTKIEVCTADDKASQTLATGRPARFSLHVDNLRPGVTCSFYICDKNGLPVMPFDSAFPSAGDRVGAEGTGTFLCEIAALPLLAGTYRIDASLAWNHELQDTIDGAFFFDVERGDFAGRVLPPWSGVGATCCEHVWIVPKAVFA